MGHVSDGATSAFRKDISAKLTLVMGGGAVGLERLPRNAAAFVYLWGSKAKLARLLFIPGDAPRSTWSIKEDFAGRIILFLAGEAMNRLGGHDIVQPGIISSFHLPWDLRRISIAVLNSPLEGEALDTYQSAKAMELICETLHRARKDTLAPIPTMSTLSLADSERMRVAHKLIEERWSEKLTLESIGRECGLNRDKLARGFREMFNCTIGEALSERRLAQAREMLLATGLPVAEIGFQNGYMNGASFTRAFSRRFGASPSDYRARCFVA